jgi:hypothetical protein
MIHDRDLKLKETWNEDLARKLTTLKLFVGMMPCTCFHEAVRSDARDGLHDMCHAYELASALGLLTYFELNAALHIVVSDQFSSACHCHHAHFRLFYPLLIDKRKMIGQYVLSSLPEQMETRGHIKMVQSGIQRASSNTN